MERHDNESLLGKMLVQMTGEELVAIYSPQQIIPRAKLATH